MTVWNSRGKRGDALENLITLTNDYYRQNHYARVDKAATPVTVVELDEKGLISKAYFEKKATVDFYGIVQGHYIAFDAKETNLDNFPLKNLHPHQVDYMAEVTEQGGLAFVIAQFKKAGRFFLIPYELLAIYYGPSSPRKSIPFSEMIESLEIHRTRNDLLHYLPVLNAYMDYKETLKLGRV